METQSQKASSRTFYIMAGALVVGGVIGFVMARKP